MTLDDDWALVLHRAVAGDRDASEAILGPCLASLRAYIRLQSGPGIRAHESVSDLVQSVCRRTLADLPKLRVHTEAAFRKRLFDTARHLLVDRARYYGARKGLENTAPHESWSDGKVELLACYASFCSPSHQAEIRDEIDRVERAMQKLSERDRDIITWSKVADWSHAQIAAELGIAPASVRAALYRAMARLAEWLGT